MSGENKFVDTSLYKNYSSTEDFFVGIIENWNLALESILLVGSLLALAKDKLGRDYYELQMRLDAQGISRTIQNRCLNVAKCQPLIQYCRKEYEKGTKPLLPNDIKVLNQIATVTKNDSDKFKDALNKGIIHSKTTYKDLVPLHSVPPEKQPPPKFNVFDVLDYSDAEPDEVFEMEQKDFDALGRIITKYFPELSAEDVLSLLLAKNRI